MQMPCLTSCASNRVEDDFPELYFPKFPAPKEIYFLDENKEEVTTEEKEIVYIIVPYEWFAGELLDFKIDYNLTKLYYEEFKRGFYAVGDK